VLFRSVEITDTLTISPASGAATGGTTGGTTADTGTGTTGSATESLQLSVGIEPSKILFDQVSSEGTSTFAAHADHVHGLDTPATPASLTVLVPGLAGEADEVDCNLGDEDVETDSGMATIAEDELCGQEICRFLFLGFDRWGLRRHRAIRSPWRERGRSMKLRRLDPR
jgi:hypothetical protein